MTSLPRMCWTSQRLWPWVGLLLACQSDYQVELDPPPTPLPPPENVDEDGGPPDWTDCTGGFQGYYHNLEWDHPMVNPLPGEDPITSETDPASLDWYNNSRLAFERYDASLDMGLSWWPVDQGWTDDPAYFAVYWSGWLRSWKGGTWRFTLGASDDVWVVVGDQVVAALPGIHPFEPVTFEVSLKPGQAPLGIYYAHRGSPESGLRFRSLSDPAEVTLCYPDFTDGE